MTKKQMQILIDNLSADYWDAHYSFRISEASELGDQLERLIERFNRLFPRDANSSSVNESLAAFGL